MVSVTPLDPGPLQINQGSDGAIHVAGDLDIASAPRLRAAIQRLADNGAQQVVLDVGGLSFCDSSGLSVFVWAHQTLPAESGLVLRNPTERLRKLLRATRLEHELDIR
jgi:anti-sigma B factor antagonist